MIITTLTVAAAIAVLAWLKGHGIDIVSGSDRP